MGMALLMLLCYLGLGLVEWKRYGHTGPYNPLEGTGQPLGWFGIVAILTILVLPLLYLVYGLLTQPW